MPTLASSQMKTLSRLDGKFRRVEGLRLTNLASKVDAEHAIVEVGSYKGKSACYLATGAQAGNGAHVYCIDLWTIGGQRDKHGGDGVKQPYDQPETYQVFLEQIERMGFADGITPIISSSQDAAAQWTQSIGLMHIDAEHSYQACIADIDAWSKHLIIGGYIALHDYSEQFPGVVQAAQERIVNSAAWADIQVDGTLLTARKVG